MEDQPAVGVGDDWRQRRGGAGSGSGVVLSAEGIDHQHIEAEIEAAPELMAHQAPLELDYLWAALCIAGHGDGGCGAR